MQLLRSLASLLAPTIALLLAACGGGTGVASGPAPSALAYSSQIATYTVCEPIPPNTPVLVGGSSSFTVIPALPDGLFINPSSGLIAGTPTEPQAETFYVVTAANGAGQLSTILSITVALGTPPSNFSYSTTEANYGLGFTIAPNVPSLNGSVDTFEIAPPLPPGLSLNPFTGIISGTPSALVAETVHTITARNCVQQSTSTQIRISVGDPNVPPTNLSYTTLNTSYVGCQSIAPNEPIFTGFATVFSVLPPLPAGLTIDSSSGVISGTPTAVQNTTTHTVTAANAAGSAAAAINVAVTAPPAPGPLSYTPSDATLVVGVNGAPLVPQVSGSITSFSIFPDLPTGLTLDPLNGLIAGIPLATVPQANYTVTASDCVGQQSITQITIEVADPAVPPSNLGYTAPASVYTACEEIAPNLPVVDGLVEQYSITPNLPPGLSFDVSTGAITGVPNTIVPNTTHIVTASNSAGQSVATIDIEVVPTAAPANLVYPVVDVAYTAGEPVQPNTPTVDGLVSLWSVVPPLPNGLSLDQETGAIIGTPTVSSVATVYTISATDCLGQSTSAQVTITVIDPSSVIPRFVYVANADGTVSGLTVTPDTGQLRHNGFSVVGIDPVDLAISGTERDLYVLNAGDGSPGSANVVLLRIDQASGRLSPVGAPTTMPDGSFSSDLVLSSTSDRLFVANPLLDSISVFNVAADGTLSEVAGSPFATQASGPTALAVDPLGRYLFSVSNGSDEISSFAIDTLTGALSGEQRQPLGGDGVSCATLFSANGTLTVQVAAASPNRLVPFTVDTADGSLTALSPEVLSAAPTKIRALTNGLDRLVYVCTNTQVERYALNDLGQPFRPLPITPYVVPTPSDIAFVADGSFAFVALAGANELSSANVLDGTTGQLSAIQPFPAPTDRTRVRNDPRAIALGSGAQPVERVTSFVYAANTNDGDVGQFEFNAAGPGLTSLLPAQVSAGVQPNDVVVHPFIEAAYVVDAVAGTMSDIFSFNIAVNGQLSTTGTYDLEDAVISGDGANALVIEPSGRFAYVVRSASPNSEIIRYAIDPGSGILTPGAAVDAGGSAQFPAIDPTGRFLYVPNRFTGDVSQYAIDPVTGALSNLGTIAAGASPSAAVVDETGRFAYVANRGSNDVSAYQIDPVSGTLSSVGPAVAAGTGPSALAVGPRGRTLYVANELAGSISRYVANLNPVDGVPDGTLIAVGPFDVPGGPRWLDFDAEGARMFVSLVTTGEVLTLSVALNGSTTLTLQDSDISAATTGTRNVSSRDRVQ